MKNKINSRSVRMTAVNTRDITLTNSFASNSTVVFTAVNNNYSGKDFRNIIDFSPYVFKGANLSNANFNNLDFENGLNNNNGQKLILPNKSKLDFLDFSGANCNGTSFEETNLTGADFSNSTITNVEFYDTKMPNAKFQGAICTNISFIETILTGAIFSKSKITGLNFDGADLTGADFSGLTMTDVSFEQANLTKANFSNTTIKSEKYGNNFKEANFTDANFSGAKFVNSADFTGGIFKNINFSNATINGTFEAINNYRYPDGNPRNFENVDFTNANLEQTYFNADQGNEIKLSNVKFTGTKFPSDRDIFITRDYTFLNGVFTYYNYMSVIFIFRPCPESVKCEV